MIKHFYLGKKILFLVKKGFIMNYKNTRIKNLLYSLFLNADINVTNIYIQRCK